MPNRHLSESGHLDGWPESHGVDQLSKNEAGVLTTAFL
jgi:hypothetical protein